MIRETYNQEELEEAAEKFDVVYTKDSSIAQLDGFKSLEEEIGLTEEQSREKTVIALRENLGGSWKQAAHLADNILDCWRHTGKPENLTRYNGFEGEEVEEAVKIARETDTYYSRLAEHRFPEKSAFLMKEDLNGLEEEVLEDLENLEFFKEERFEMDKLRMFNSKNQVVRAVVDNIKAVQAEKVGVIVQEDTEYNALLKSVLDSESIDYHRSTGLSDSQDFRNVLSLIRTGLTGKRVRLRDLRLLLAGMGVETRLNDSNKFLESINDSGLEEVKNLINAIEYLSFGEVLERYEELAGTELAEVRNAAQQIGFIETPVKQIDDLEYLVRQLNLEDGQEREGVEIAGPYDKLRVDREHVFILGMSSEWNQEIVNREWRDVETIEKRRKRKFESVIQAGKNQYYLGIDKEMNKSVIPCFYLNQLREEEFTEFSELPHERYTAESSESDGFRKLDTMVEAEDINRISQTRLNNYAISPRVYYISQLVNEADEINRKKGSLFHDFAEFYVNYPNFVAEKGTEKFESHIVNQLSSLVEDSEVEKLETEVKIGLKSIKKFLVEEGFERPDSSLTEHLGQNQRPNSFSQLFGKKIRSEVAEASFSDDKLRFKGKIDLVLDTNHLVDYKSGRKKTRKNLVKSATVDLIEDVDWPDFQPAMYLSFLRKHVKDQKLYFTYYYFLNDIPSQIKNLEVDENKVTLTYYPRTFETHVPRREVFESLIKDVAKSNDRRKTLEKLGTEGFEKFFSENPFPKVYDAEELYREGYVERFVDYAKAEIGDYKYVEKGCKSALRKIVKINQENFFEEDLDRVEDYVENSIDKINEYKRSRFPVDAKDESSLPFNDMVIK